MSKSNQWGGAGRGQGRKPVGENGTITVSIRLTQEQRDKLTELGGAKWIRKKIDQEIDHVETNIPCI